MASDTAVTFADLNLDPKVLAAITEAGYETPTPIQAQAIPQALMARDVLGIAQTGTGKTAAFTLPMISILAQGRARARMPRSLVLCPTRELAAQVAENFETYGKNHKLSMALLIGGVSFKDQDKLIDRGVDVLIATPGRLLDHFERGKLMLTGIEIMVVDEADRMLDMGFIPDIERIFKLTPFTRQTLFFSATMPPEITRLTQEFLHNPQRVEVARQATTGENITQKIIAWKAASKDTSDREKRDVLRGLLDGEGEKVTNAIVFCNRKSNVDIVAKSLAKHGYNAAAIHGDLDQKVRMRTLDGFRSGDLKILVASDVAARGLDIPAVSHVINFDVPIHSEDYVHRIGRTGRAGRKGDAYTLCLPVEEKYLDKIEDMIGSKIDKIDPPEGSIRPLRGGGSRQKSDDGERRPRGGRGRREEAPKTVEPQAAETPAVVEDAQRADAKPSEPRESNRRSKAPRDENRRDDTRREDTRRERGGRGRRDDKPVLGLGDHVPAFIMIPLPDLKSLRSRTATADETPAAEIEEEADAAIEAA
ncbi:MAG: DEAD/DEAH box helicase, partial [Pseudomonadota bacterium]